MEQPTTKQTKQQGGMLPRKTAQHMSAIPPAHTTRVSDNTDSNSDKGAVDGASTNPADLAGQV